ncbi:Glycosyl transferase group 1 [Tenacibaculum litopenaei]|uniref:glycosyltransferase family 4 protein n=1 Tax=Tenacibaculum litopenaei TaxID=396016 RepID=UPI0038932142
MKKLAKKNIIVDIERMKYPNTGLHNYCKNLADYLVEDTSFDYHFFTHKKIDLDDKFKRINRKLIDKVFLKPAKKFSLWHGTYQTTKFVPQKAIKFVLTIHDLNFLYEDKSESKRQKLIKQIQNRIDRADYITTISTFVLEDIKKHLNLEGKKVKVVYNGVNLVEYPDFNEPKIRPEGDYLFTIGTVLPKKNFHVLIPMLKANPTLKLYIGGIQPDENYKAKIVSLAAEYGVTDQLVLLGAISEEEKYWYLKNCKAFLFPSIAEGFGIPVIEAMHLGKPVFLSTHTSLPEIGGAHAYYFENFDPDHLNAVFNQGMKDFEDNQRAESLKQWAAQFSWEKASKEYIEIYKELLAE